jgi:hypothetical protein
MRCWGENFELKAPAISARPGAERKKLPATLLTIPAPPRLLVALRFIFPIQNSKLTLPISFF